MNIFPLVNKIVRQKKEVKWCGGPHTWAVVTGATDGIGLEYARQLAQKDYNLLLFSRNPQKLKRVKNEIQNQYKNCEVRVLAVDFTSTDIYERIEEEFKKLEEIHVLVNNVGILNPNERLEYLTRIPNLNQFISDIINVNIIACTRLTALVLPSMESRGRGVIINLASFGAIIPLPMATLYSATKAYVDFMSRGLNEEFKNKGIVVQCLLTGLVSTKMSKNVRQLLYNRFTVSPELYVKSALDTVGRFDRCAGHSNHAMPNILAWCIGILNLLLDVDLGPIFIHNLEKLLMKNKFVMNNKILVNHKLS